MSGASSDERVLVVNVGSSSCKVSLSANGEVRELDADRWRQSVTTPDVILHRFVHGGGIFHGPTEVTPEVRRQIESLIELAPLQTVNALAMVDELTAAFPGAKQVACFDTCFHETIAPAASTYAIPDAWRSEHGIRKYGFHGFAHEYADRHGRGLAGGEPHRVLSCHLGSGSSLAAIVDGRSVDTTMGFTPLDGLVMATRSGAFDPGALVWLLSTGAVGIEDASQALEHGSGLTGLAGLGDMQAILRARDEGDAAATLAYEVWRHRLVSQIGGMITAMSGVDLIVFGGGIGEHAATARADVAESLRFLGLELDAERNRAAQGDAVISTPESKVAVVVVTAREDLAMLHATAAS